MVYFALGYGIVWLLVLGYTAIIHNQQSKMEKQLVVLEEIVNQQRS